MAECLVAWYFVRRRRMRVAPRPDGTDTRNVDLAIHSPPLVLATEVKAPFVPIAGRSWSGGDERTILSALVKAGGQCKKGRPNLVVLVPVLRSPIFKQLIGRAAELEVLRRSPHGRIDQGREQLGQHAGDRLPDLRLEGVHAAPPSPAGFSSWGADSQRSRAAPSSRRRTAEENILSRIDTATMTS
jgi:hypothetical protein